MKESERIQIELNNLGPEFSKPGIVRWVLKRRIKQEKKKESGMAV